MKKNLFSMGVMLAAAFTLTNCAEEMNQPVQAPSADGSFEIIAQTVETRTVNDGLSTKWTAADSINVFHAEAGSDVYVNDGRFEIAEADLESGRFTGELGSALEAEATYDWYAFYPYTRQKESPADDVAGWTYIGHSKGLSQNGYDSKAALKGSVCPLYGVAEAVAGNKAPHITMQHLSSVIAIEVTNVTENPIKVTTASFTAQESIVGSYYITFAGGIPAYKESGDAYVYNTATVNVSEATELAKDQKATLYLAIKPFTAKAEDDLIITVNGYEKILTITEDVTFHAGKIKTLRFAYDKVEAPLPEGVVKATLTFDDKSKRTEFDTSHQVWVENGITFTNEKGSSTSNVADYSNPARFYKSSNITISAPGNILALEFNCTGLADQYVTPFSSLEGASSANGVVTIPLDGTTNTVTYEKLSAQARAYALTVTYTEGEGGEIPETKVLESIAVSEPIVSYNVGDNFVKPVVIATYSDASTADVTESATFSGYDMATAGTQTVTVSYTEDDIIATTEYEITVNAVEVETITTTIEDFLAITEENANTYIVTGKIVNIEEISSQYKNATLTIADDNGNELYIYRMKAAEGGDAIEALGLTLGDILTVSGKWGIHGGAVQLVSGVYVNHEDQEAPEQDVIKAVTIAEFLTAPVSTVTKYRLTGEIVLLEAFNTQYNNVSLTISDGTGEAYVYRMSAPEGKVINELGLTVGDILTVEGNRGAYNNAPQMTNAVYISHDDVEVEEPEVPAGSVVAQAVFAEFGYENTQSVDGTEINLDENVTIVFKKGSAGTAPTYYTSGSAIRLYQNGATLDVTANGKTITEIELTFSQNHYYIAPDCGTLSAEASVRTWTGEATSVKFTTTGTDKNHRAYLAAIKVTYAE